MGRTSEDRDPGAILRVAAARGLQGVAQVLNVASEIARSAARQLELPTRGRDRAGRPVVEPDAPEDDLWSEPAPPPEGGMVDSGPGPVGPMAAEDIVADAEAEPVSPPQPPPTRVVDAPSRKPETHVADLAQRNARDVIAAVEGLSTEELGQLHEYESTHRQRKTVLAAINRAAAAHTTSG